MALTRTIRESASTLAPFLRFSVLAAISLLVSWKPLVSTLALVLRDDRYTHLLLILPVTMSLIYLEWKPSESHAGTVRSAGLALVVAALLLMISTRLPGFAFHSDEQLTVNMLGLVLWWMGAFIVSFGTRAFWRALFPLCFLLWLVPIPEFVLNPLVKLLQQGSVASARALFMAVGTPIAQDGTRITIPGLTIEVAAECSSIRSSLMLVVTTMVLAQVSLRSAWRKAVIIAVAIPLSVAKNGLRIFVLGMLATRVDRSFITGKLHHQGGIIYFLIALGIIISLIWIAHRSERRSRSSAASPPEPVETQRSVTVSQQ